jgi:hypothetical protein
MKALQPAARSKPGKKVATAIHQSDHHHVTVMHSVDEAPRPNDQLAKWRTTSAGAQLRDTTTTLGENFQLVCLLDKATEDAQRIQPAVFGDAIDDGVKVALGVFRPEDITPRHAPATSSARAS